MDSLITSAVAKLTQAQFHCITAFPDFRLPQLESPMVVVSLPKSTLQSAVAGDFIGLDDELNVFYGMRFDGELHFEIYTPYRSGGSVCTETALAVLDTLRSGFTGYTLRKLWGSSTVYDPKTDCFRSTVTAALSAWLYRAEA